MVLPGPRSPPSADQESRSRTCAALVRAHEGASGERAHGADHPLGPGLAEVHLDQRRNVQPPATGSQRPAASKRRPVVIGRGEQCR